jgi:hypothetical protein
MHIELEHNLLVRMMWTVLGASIVIGVAGVIFGFMTKEDNAPVTSFAECAKLFPVQESYPRRCIAPEGLTFIEDVRVPPENQPTIIGSAAELLRNISPAPGMLVSDPIVITGEARLMYFEGSFPITVSDANGNLIAEGVGTAQSDWMTEDFVPFTASLSWIMLPETPSGIITLKKDNPSGLPENDRDASFPIRFNVSIESATPED